MGAIKGAFDKVILNMVVRTLFERIPFAKKVFSWVDGKKTVVGRVVAYSSLLVYGLTYVFPQVPQVDQVVYWYGFAAGYILEQLGVAHRVDKAKREDLFSGEVGSIT